MNSAGFEDEKGVFQPSLLGDTLAGLAAPLAFLWFVYTALMQREELDLTRQELRTANKLAEKQQKQNDHANKMRDVATLIEIVSKYNIEDFKQAIFANYKADLYRDVCLKFSDLPITFPKVFEATIRSFEEIEFPLEQKPFFLKMLILRLQADHVAKNENAEVKAGYEGIVFLYGHLWEAQHNLAIDVYSFGKGLQEAFGRDTMSAVIKTTEFGRYFKLAEKIATEESPKLSDYLRTP